jgi:HK97 family phage portal protein
MGPADPGAVRGMGVLEAHLRGVLSLADDQGRQALSLSGSAVPTGVLRVADTPADPLTRAEASAVKEGWIRSQSSRTVAVLNARTTFEPIAWNPTEGQMLEARQFSLHEIALIFGLDPSWLGVSGSSMTYSNIEQQAVNLVKFTLRGHISRIEQTLSLLFPRGTFVEANLDGILRGDTAARYDAHVKALSAGFLTVDEVREMEGRPPLPSPTPEVDDDIDPD